ncbi:MAG: peptidoglycan editing factor PgeF [Pseudomonadota bacterium]
MTTPDDIPSPLLAAPSLRHGFFGRRGGVSRGLYASLNAGAGSGDDPALVAENRARVARRLGARHLVTLFQTHSATAVALDAPFPAGKSPKADGMATRTPGLALGILTADCAPVLLADTHAGVIGAAHCGWRGTLDGVIAATVACMAGLGAAPSRMRAAIGPCIAQASYEVGDELRQAYLAAEAGAARHFTPAGKKDKWHFALAEMVATQLAAAGIDQVDALGHDTYGEEDRFFSYRRASHRGEKDYGRQIAAIMLLQ